MRGEPSLVAMRETLDVRLCARRWSRPVSRGGASTSKPTLGSTNLEAARRPEPWRVVVADHQQAGRGRLGRGTGRPRPRRLGRGVRRRCPRRRSQWGWLPLLTGLAVAGPCARWPGCGSGLKWPNDVLVAEDGGRKVCGVLCELHAGGGVVVGHRHQRGPAPGGAAGRHRDLAAAVRRAGVRREQLVRRRSWTTSRALHADVMTGGAALDACPGGIPRACRTMGLVVEVQLGSGAVAAGRAVAVDDDGRLVVRGLDGEYAVAAGDVVHVRSAGLAGPGPASTAMTAPAPRCPPAPRARPVRGGRPAGRPDEVDRPGCWGGRAAWAGARSAAAPRSRCCRARKFWHALGFPIVEDEDDAVHRGGPDGADGRRRLVRERQFDEQTALAMTRAFARTTDRLAVWQTQLMAEVLADLRAGGGPATRPTPRAVPDLGAGRERRRAAKLGRAGRRPRAAARLRLAPAPDRRDRPHARRRRRRRVRRGRDARSRRASPTWSTSPRWCAG